MVQFRAERGISVTVPGRSQVAGIDYPVEPARILGSVSILKCKRAVGLLGGHADNFPVHQVGGGFDEVNLACGAR